MAPASPPSPIFSGRQRRPGVDQTMLVASDPPGALATLDDDTDDTGWLLVLVPLPVWSLIDAIRAVEGRPTRSAVANDLLRRALSVSGASQ